MDKLLNLVNLDADAPFKYFVGLSMGAHIILVLVFTVKANFFPSDDILIQQAVRVDMVALPDKVQPKKAKPKPKKKPPAPKKKKQTKKKKKPSLKKAKSTQKQALDQLKAFSALDNIKDEESKEPQKPKEFKGNVLSKGSGLTGVDKLEFDEFYGKLLEHIKSNWDIPQWLENSDLKAEIVIKIDSRGYITQRKLLTSSGNQIFDTTAMEAIRKSSPTPLPPRRLVSIIKSSGLVLGFP